MIDEDEFRVYQGKLLQGDRRYCHNVVEKLLRDGINIKDLYLQLFQRSLYEIGMLWETNKISVATEHLTTAITESLINLAFPYLKPENQGSNKVVVMSTPGEFHQIGARIVADYFEMNGWNSYFLGANTPESDAYKFIDAQKPDVIAISMSVFFSINSLKNLVITFQDEYPQTKIILGGQGLKWGGGEVFNKYDNVEILLTLDDLDNKIFGKYDFK